MSHQLGDKNELALFKTMAKPDKLEAQETPEKNLVFCQKNLIILEELGRTSLAGRVTFKAQDNRTDEIVVIKKFQFISNS